MHTNYSDSELQSINTLKRQGFYHSEIADKLGRSERSIAKAVARLRIQDPGLEDATRHARRERAASEMEKRVKEIISSANIQEAMARTGYSRSGISYTLQQARNRGLRWRAPAKWYGQTDPLEERDPVVVRLTRRLAAYRGRAKQSNLGFDLTAQWVQDAFAAQAGLCFYSGVKMTADGITGATVDRVDSSKGYTIENSVLCCCAVNQAKGVLPINQFLGMCRKVVATMDARRSARHDRLPGVLCPHVT